MGMVAVRLSDRANKIGSDIKVKGNDHQFQVTEIIIFVLIDAFKPGMKLLLKKAVVAIPGFGGVFAGQSVCKNFKHTEAGVRNKIESLTVKRIQKARCVPN